MLDITLDFETCSLCPTAAVMSIGAVAWMRDAEKSPFYKLSSDALDTSSVFSCHIDLRSMFVNNFTFDGKTAEWWGTKSEEAKAKNKRIKEAYADDVLYYCIKTPAAVFWVGVFSLLWPLIIYVEFFWKKDKKED